MPKTIISPPNNPLKRGKISLFNDLVIEFPGLLGNFHAHTPLSFEVKTQFKTGKIIGLHTLAQNKKNFPTNQTFHREELENIRQRARTFSFRVNLG